ncbi:uncharacterized protein LOC131626598 isoform X2 [Vicia villosa]|uniref:uncharacterized protein LOC131626598 isoform X2 n=1 Tax=Vicia villosa TaxID=3911 RepID=UPI00273C8215|nr:uncharacterized protein LOC131626598 isoform X2 [Vicia villosa]
MSLLHAFDWLPFLIKAVATADMETMLDVPEQPLDEREKLRRSRISKANKGKSPWNKGRKHTPETLQKIKERTRIAMQSPKVKMKLTNLGHAQSPETKLKIGVGIKKLWEKKREIKMLQETCCFHWQNLIAQASRQGFIGQEQLQWNSYETLDCHLKQEWLESVEQRKLMPRSTSGSRAPKSLEQRKKIAQAIAAKWATPDYRERVISAIVKYHDSNSTERKPRARPSYSAQPPKKRKPVTKKDSDSIFVKNSSKTVKPIKLRKRKPPAYKDPLVNSKLEMIKNIRAQRASVDTRQTQAIQQARLLIAEAEKAAKALEVAAEKSPIAQASLLETRKLIAEAIQSLESIDTQKTEDCNVPSVSLSEEVNKKNESTFEVGNHSQMVHINGHTTLSSSVYKLSGDFGYLSLERPVNGDPELQLTNGCASFPFSLNSQINQYSSSNLEKETEQYESSENESDDSPAEDETLSKSDSPTEDDTPSKSDSPAEDETQLRSPVATKKWVRGRLVELNEEQQ